MQINQPAPGFELPDLDGNSCRLSDTRGRIVIVNFWSAECPQVERTDALLQKYLFEWGDDVILLPIAANVNESMEMLRKVSITRGWPIVLHDAGNQIADLYGAVTTPHVFVIDKNGILRYRGAFDNMTFRQREATRSYVWDVVQALRAGREPDLVETAAYGCTIIRSD